MTRKTACQRARDAEQIEIQKAWAKINGGPYGKCPQCGYRPHMDDSLVIHHEPPKGMGGTAIVYQADELASHRLMPLCRRCHAEIHGLRQTW